MPAVAVGRSVADMQTFLVEHYEPGWSVERLERTVARVRVAAGELRVEGKCVRLLRSTIVPADESVLCVFEAPTRELVEEAYRRAGTSFERISSAISLAGSSAASTMEEE
jgi:hypothetical protein